MYFKELCQLKDKLEKECQLRIEGIIDQIIANESLMKASWEDENAVLKGTALELKIILTVEDNIGNRYSIGSRNSAIDIK